MTDQTVETQNHRSPAAGSLVRSGLVWFGSRGRSTAPEIEPLVRALRANHPKADVSVIERAYETAELHHRGQFRNRGSPTSPIPWRWPRSSPRWA
jgi:hypothetical protein